MTASGANAKRQIVEALDDTVSFQCRHVRPSQTVWKSLAFT